MIPTFNRKPAIKVKTYDSDGAYQHDANRLFKDGYVPISVVRQDPTVLMGHTILKWVTLVGVLTGPTRTKPKLTVTYRRTSNQAYFYPAVGT